MIKKVGRLKVHRIKTIRIDKILEEKLEDFDCVFNDVWIKNGFLYNSDLITCKEETKLPSKITQMQVSGKYKSGTRFNECIFFDTDKDKEIIEFIKEKCTEQYI